MFGRKKKDEDEEQKQEERINQDHQTSPTYAKEASEDALLLKVVETLKGKMDRTGKVLELQKEGYIGVINLGEEDKIFDVDVIFENIEGIEGLEEDLEIYELDPQESWEKQYTLDEADESELPFTIEEVINTAADGDEASTVLVYNKEAEIEVTLKLAFNRTLDKVEIQKMLPEGFSNMKVSNASDGKAQISDNKLIWTIDSVDDGNEAECTLSGKMLVDTIDKRPTGDIFITYSGEGRGSTKVVIKAADGYVRCKTYVESDEKEDAPDNWENKLTFENRSEFPIELKILKVYDDEGTYLSQTFAEDEVIIPSGEKWYSEVWEKESEALPLFKKHVEYTVKPEKIAQVSGDLEIPETELAVAYGKGKKHYSRTEFSSFRETPFDVTTTVSNDGSVEFSELTIIDELPEYFKLEEPEKVQVFIKKGDKETALKKGSYEVSIEPDADSSEKRQLICKINEKVEPETEILLKYTPILNKPPADFKFETEPVANALLSEPAPLLDIPIEDDIFEITIAHLRRKVSWSKDVIPLKTKDDYTIEILFINRGNTPIEDVTLRDFVPEAFRLTEEDKTFESEILEETDEGRVRAWNIGIVEPGQEVLISYTVHGEGVYHSKELFDSM